MSLKNPFLWRDTNKTMNKESTLLPNINKINLLASNSINNTKIKNIQDQISVYESKIFKMENTLFKKEEELRVKEKMLKDCQRRKTRQNKEERQKKHFNVMNDTKKAENLFDKKAKKISQIISNNNSTRETIDSLRREKNIYIQINDKISKEIENLKKSYRIAEQQLTMLASNRCTLESQINDDIKQLEKEKQFAVQGLLSMQEKLQQENRKVKNNLNTTSKSRFHLKTTFGNNFNTTRKALQVIAEENSKERTGDADKDSNRVDADLNIQYQNPNTSHYETDFKGINKTVRTNYSNDIKLVEKTLHQKEELTKYRLEELQKLFQILYSETGTNNISDLTSYFLRLEEENKELYKNTKFLIEEIDKLKDQKLAMQIEVKNIESTKEKRQSVKEDIVNEITEKIEEINEKIVVVNDRKENYSKLVNQLKLSIPIILKKLSFEDEDYEISSESIDNDTINQYLYILEKKANIIFKLVKENNLDSFIFDKKIANGGGNKIDDQKWKNDLNALEDIMSKLRRKRIYE